MKKFGINCQLRNNLPFSLIKAAMNAPHFCKLRKDGLTGIGHGAMMLTKRKKDKIQFGIQCSPPTSKLVA